MAVWTKSWAAGAAVAALFPAGAGAAGVTEVLQGFKPYRAVYDMSLGPTDEDSSIEGVTGRIVTEFTGSVCDGFTTTFRFVTRIDGGDGNTRLSDLRTTSYETADGSTFQFVSQDYNDRKLSDETKGVASREADGVYVDLVKPAAKQVKLGTAVMFPTLHMAELVSRAEEGDLIYQAELFDGGEDGDRALPTTAVIGPAVTGDDTPGDDDAKAVAALGGGDRWPVRLSYFDPEAAPGEQTPMYALSFLLYPSGISRRLALDYGDFTILGRLVQVEMLEPTPCDE